MQPAGYQAGVGEDVMTSVERSNNFVLGLNLLSKYKTEKFSVSVAEQTSIAVEGLKLLPQQDLDELELLGWIAFNVKGEGGAYYHKLDYTDY